jgi:hypothetical protein
MFTGAKQRALNGTLLQAANRWIGVVELLGCSSFAIKHLKL